MGGLAGTVAAVAAVVMLALTPAASADPADQPGAPVADTTPPNTTIGEVKVKGRTARIVFASSEPGGGYRCNLDSQPLTGCDSPLKLRRLKPGRHRLRVTAVDAAGNADPTGATAKFRIRKKRHDGKGGHGGKGGQHGNGGHGKGAHGDGNR